MDSSDWFQGTTIPNETVPDSSSPSGTITDPMLSSSGPLMEPRLRPPHDEAIKCPRCDSTHTKFCYYNNYSLTQPRYFCKTCRRYWTKGGTLRHIPVGGGCRKNKKVSAISRKSSSGATASHINLIMNSSDLQLSYPESTMGNYFNVGGGGGGNNNGGYAAEMGGVDVDLGQNYYGGNLCYPFGGMITLDSINNVFTERGLIGYNHEGNDDHTIGSFDVKPNLLAFEWQDHQTADGYGSSWGGLVHGYGPSTAS